MSIFRIAETDIQGENVTARQILADAEKRIHDEFADQAELRGELEKAIRGVKRGIARRTPQAMILAVRGTVRLQSAAGLKKAAVPQALLNLDDRLSLSPDAQVQLVFLSDLHKERLKGGREVTVDTKGCEPADAVLERDTSVPMTFVRLPKGTFCRGWDGTNAALKWVIQEDFEIAVHTVTQGQWQAVMGDNPSHFSRQGRESAGVKDISDEEMKKRMAVAMCTACRRTWSGNMLVGAGRLPKQNVPGSSTLTNRPTISPRNKPTSTAPSRPARRRRGRAWAARLELARTPRTSWGCATCTATWGNGASTPSTRANFGCAGVVTGCTTATAARRSVAAGIGRWPSGTTAASVLPAFPSGTPARPRNRRGRCGFRPCCAVRTSPLTTPNA